MMMIEIACRMNPNTFRVEYFNKATGKQLAYRALEDTYSYRVGRTKALPLAGSQIKAGTVVSYQAIQNGDYFERYFELIELD